MVINDLVPAVVSKLRGRTDKTQSCPYYIAQALIDLSQNYEFEELKVTGPLTNFVQTVSRYPLRGYDPLGVSGNPFIAAPQDRITFLRNWFTYFDTSGTITVGQSTGMEMKDRDIRVVEPMSKILGLPTVYCLSGSYDNQGYILVGFMPDNPYPTQLTYQRQHPFNVTYEQVLLSISNTQALGQIAQSKIYMPIDWTEIIITAAAEKACNDIGMVDIGQLYHNQLYGYKDKHGNEMPGIITVRMTQQDRQTSFNERQLRPVVRRYT
jgi:hypothetical protein